MHPHRLLSLAILSAAVAACATSRYRPSQGVMTQAQWNEAMGCIASAARSLGYEPSSASWGVGLSRIIPASSTHEAMVENGRFVGSPTSSGIQVRSDIVAAYRSGGPVSPSLRLRSARQAIDQQCLKPVLEPRAAQKH